MAEEGIVADDSGAMDVMSGGFDMLNGAMKGITGVLEATFQVISKLMNAIIDASPMLQGVLKIVDKMFKMILLPIGNMIARLLLPMTIKMANRTMQFLQKYGSAGPDKLGEMMESGMTLALESFVDIISVVLNKVLGPVMIGLAKALGNVILYAITFGQMGSKDVDSLGLNENYFEIDEMKNLLGSSTEGTASIINQFGMTVQTGNKMIGTSQTELATIFYHGATDIANGFQSLHTVLAIGTPKILAKFETDFKTAAAGVYTSITTLETSFGDLIEYLERFHITPETEDVPKEETKKQTKWGMADWMQFMISPVGMGVKSIDTWNRGYKIGGATQSESERATSSRIFGAFKETALAPIDGNSLSVSGTSKTKTTGQNITVNVYGDTYGMDDFDRKIEKSISKYSSRIRGAY